MIELLQLDHTAFLHREDHNGLLYDGNLAEAGDLILAHGIHHVEHFVESHSTELGDLVESFESASGVVDGAVYLVSYDASGASHCDILLSVRALVPFDIISISQMCQVVNTFIKFFFIFFINRL